MLRTKQVKRIGEHFLFWFLYWIFISFSAGLYDFDFKTVALFNLSNLPLTLLTTYLFVYGILPFYTQKRTLYFISFSALLVIASLVLKRIYLQYIQFPLFYDNTDWTFRFFDWYRIVGHFLQLCATIGLVSAIKIYRDWKQTRDKLEMIQVEKRNMELNYLKAQTSPHFLFNTLNSIYYDVVNKNDQSADSIIRLSELLRLVLYECSEDFIPVEKEIQLIEHYIALQKRRYLDRLIVYFSYSGDVNQLTPPLISFSLIENAFKHGMTESIGKCVIHISIQIDADNYSLTIKNPVSNLRENNHPDAPKGLGLKNIRRQLSLIYDDNFSLSNESHENIYSCKLKLPLRVE